MKIKIIEIYPKAKEKIFAKNKLLLSSFRILIIDLIKKYELKVIP